MAIIGLTHDDEGKVKISRSITTKVAIGEPPTDGKNYPTKLDYFVFKKLENVNGEMVWVEDKEITERLGPKPTRIQIVLIENDVDEVFKTEYAAFVQRGRWCHGDGQTAYRRDLGDDGKGWGPFQILQDGACANGNDEWEPCPFVEQARCAPNGDLYFMLADAPKLGSICRLHTQSYQSIRQIYSALTEIKRVAGRLMWLTVTLFVHPAKNRYEDPRSGRERTGIKHVLGIELAAQDLKRLQGQMIESYQTLQLMRGELENQTTEYEDLDSVERGKEITDEFYPTEAQQREAEEAEERERQRQEPQVIPPAAQMRPRRRSEAAQDPPAPPREPDPPAPSPLPQRASQRPAEQMPLPNGNGNGKKGPSVWFAENDEKTLLIGGPALQLMRPVLIELGGRWEAERNACRLPRASMPRFEQACRTTGVSCEEAR